MVWFPHALDEDDVNLKEKVDIPETDLCTDDDDCIDMCLNAEQHICSNGIPEKTSKYKCDSTATCNDEVPCHR